MARTKSDTLTVFISLLHGQTSTPLKEKIGDTKFVINFTGPIIRKLFAAGIYPKK